MRDQYGVGSGRRARRRRHALEAKLEERLCGGARNTRIGGSVRAGPAPQSSGRTLLVLPERAEDFCRIVHVVAIDDSVRGPVSRVRASMGVYGARIKDALVDVVGEQGSVEEERDDLEREEEAHGQEGVRDHFGEDELRGGAGETSVCAPAW